MSESIPCRQLTSLSPIRQSHDFVLWHPSRESHQQTHIKICDVRIRFSACGSEPSGPIRSYHFMNSSSLRYQVPNDHCTTKTSDCVFDHHLLISSPNVFKIEASRRHDDILATGYRLSTQRITSSSPSPPEKDIVETSKSFVFIDFPACIASVFYNIISWWHHWQQGGPTPTYSDGGHRYSKGGIMLWAYPTQPYCLLSSIGPSVILRPIYRPLSLLHSLPFLDLLSSLHTPIWSQTLCWSWQIRKLNFDKNFIHLI